MRLWKNLLYVTASVAGMMMGAWAHAAPIYDTNGFTPTRFSAASVNVNDPTVIGNLRGQDQLTITNGWRQFGSQGGTAVSNAVVDANGGVNGLGDQGVRVTRTAQDNRWSPVYSDPAKLVDVSWRMRVNATAGGNPYGPFFGIEANDDDNVTPATSHRVGGLGVDAKTGEVLYFISGGALDIVPGNETVALGSWNLFRLAIDFNTKKYSGFLNGNPLFTALPFSDATAVQLDEAFITGLRAAAGSDGNDAGVAYFDDYVVSSVPEPGTGLIMGLGALALLRRTRKNV